MANSIANLAVIISGHTKPLEDAMKKTQSKFGSFGKSISHGVGAGLGAMGLDKMEAAMKKAIADMPHLAEAAERAEKSFGNILLKVTGVGWLLPKVAGVLESVSDWMEGTTAEMRKQAELQKQALEFEKELKGKRIESIEELNKSLDAQLDAIDPMREQLRIAEMLKQDAGANFNPIGLNDAKRKFEFIQAHKQMEELKKSTAKWNDLLDQAEEEWGKMREEAEKFQEAFGPITKAQADLEKQNALIEESRKLIQDQIPDVQKWAEKLAEAKAAFLGGSMGEQEFDAVAKKYGELLKTANKQQEVKLSGAATAGSEAAYSILANAQANRGSGNSVAEKTLQEEVTQTKELKKQSEYQKKMANGAGYLDLLSRIKVVNLGGA